MRDDFSMSIASCCYQHPVRHIPTIIEDRIAGQCGHFTIRFLHDQMRRRKIPIAALSACKSSIECAMRDAAQPQC